MPTKGLEKSTKIRKSGLASRCYASWKRSSCCRPSIALWKDHLLSMDHLKEGIGLRGYGQKNPLQEYQKEGFDMFEDMDHRVQEDVMQKLFTVELARENAPQEIAVEQPRPTTHGVSVMAKIRSRPSPTQRLAVRPPKLGATMYVPAAAVRNISVVTANSLTFQRRWQGLTSRVAVTMSLKGRYSR